jgi:hypothetical protein
MPERRHIRVSEAQDGRSERPARWYGATPSRGGLLSAYASGFPGTGYSGRTTDWLRQ